MKTAEGAPGAGTASPAKSPALRPRDAATLILVDSSAGPARVLLGKRRMDMKFMPGKYVFPGGRVDKSDRSIELGDDLAEAEVAKLMVDMKEAGIIIGRPGDRLKAPADASWQRFFAQGFLPSLAPLRFFARAITPPGRPRRFDTRFFCVDTSAIAFRGEPPEDELSDLVWMELQEARNLDLPPITRVILEDLGDRLKTGPLSGSNAPVPYYFNRHGSFKRELISV
jgi:8-oxo-dGTP pyrophosphatase MutT (NUDIX family)